MLVYDEPAAIDFGSAAADAVRPWVQSQAFGWVDGRASSVPYTYHFE